jgi:hypothetical protein
LIDNKQNVWVRVVLARRCAILKGGFVMNVMKRSLILAACAGMGLVVGGLIAATSTPISGVATPMQQPSVAMDPNAFHGMLELPALSGKYQQWFKFSGSMVFQAKIPNDLTVFLGRTQGNDLTTGYEFVVGGWANGQSAIRRGSGTNPLITNKNVIAAPAQFNTYWISANAGTKVLSVGTGSVVGQNVLIQFTVTEDISTVAWISFSTWDKPGVYAPAASWSKETVDAELDAISVACGSLTDGTYLALAVDLNGKLEQYSPYELGPMPWSVVSLKDNTGAAFTTPLDTVAVDSIGNAFVNDTKGAVYTLNIANKTVTPLPAGANNTTVKIDQLSVFGTDLWAVDHSTQTVYQYDFAQKAWVARSGSGVCSHVAVGSMEGKKLVLALNNTGHMYRLKPELNPDGTGEWEKVSEKELSTVVIGRKIYGTHKGMLFEMGGEKHSDKSSTSATTPTTATATTAAPSITAALNAGATAIAASPAPSTPAAGNKPAEPRGPHWEPVMDAKGKPVFGVHEIACNQADSKVFIDLEFNVWMEGDKGVKMPPAPVPVPTTVVPTAAVSTVAVTTVAPTAVAPVAAAPTAAVTAAVSTTKVAPTTTAPAAAAPTTAAAPAVAGGPKPIAVAATPVVATPTKTTRTEAKTTGKATVKTTTKTTTAATTAAKAKATTTVAAKTAAKTAPVAKTSTTAAKTTTTAAKTTTTAAKATTTAAKTTTTAKTTAKTETKATTTKTEAKTAAKKK